MKSIIRNFPKRTIYLLPFVILIAITLPIGGYAQLENETWSDPLNLSRSGAADDPYMVADPGGLIHVVWSDEFSGVNYSRGNGQSWTPAVPIAIPFGDYRPLLVADPNGRIHAFWKDINNSAFYSSANATSFEQPGAWSGQLGIGNGVLAFDAAVDDLGNVYFTYLRADEEPGQPAGIYFRSWSPTGQSWSPTSVIYQSPYFRPVTDENARVRISGAIENGVQKVYIAWDLPPRDRVMLIKSEDGGQTWNEAQDIDEREPSDGATSISPSKVILRAYGSLVHLIWQAGHGGQACSHYHKWSEDGGITWSPRRTVVEDVAGCAQDYDFVRDSGGLFMVYSNYANQSYLIAWDGRQWSIPARQELPTNFTDQETNRRVNLGCPQVVLSRSQMLYSVGCDLAVGQDIWISSKPLGDITAWFPAPPVWQEPVSVAAGYVRFVTPAILVDGDDRIHVLWSQSEGIDVTNPGASIYYSNFETARWSRPIPILKSPGGRATQPAIAEAPGNRLVVAWTDEITGQIYFSWTTIEQAGSSSGWSSPLALPTPIEAASFPDIRVGPDGTIYVAFVVSFNEQRGIYLTQSRDGGLTWSEPVKVFDAQAVNWQMVGKPNLAITDTDNLHVVWTQFAYPPDAEPVGLYYANSSDGGLSFSSPELVVQQAVIWTDIAGTAGQVVQRVWQVKEGSRVTLWYDRSEDNGQTWTSPASVAFFDKALGATSLAVDHTGRLHLAQIIYNQPDEPVLLYWLQDGSRWQPLESLALGSDIAVNDKTLVSSISSKGLMGIVYSGLSENADTGDLFDQLFYTSRIFELPPLITTPVPTSAPIPTVMATATIAPTQAFTPTPAVESNSDAGPQNSMMILLGSWGGFIAGAIITAMVVIFAFWYILRKGRNH